MSFAGLIIFLILVGVGLYLVNTYVPMAAPIKNILNVVVIIVVIIIVLNAFGLFNSLGMVRVPQIR